MLLLLGLLIPIVFAVIGFRYFREHLLWWEYAALFATYFLAFSVIYWISESSSLSDTEYETDLVEEVRYYEPWNEYIHRICTRRIGKVTTTYNCSYVKYHGPQWEVRTTSGHTLSVPQSLYQKLGSLFQSPPVFHELNRNSFTKDGDMYSISWRGDQASSFPVTWMQDYDNPVQAASLSTFHYQKVEEEEAVQMGLFSYPEIDHWYRQPAVLGDTSQDAKNANFNLRRLNGKLNSKYQIQTYILVFHDKPSIVANYQESLWMGGNRNELVICVGIDKQRKVTWAKVFSWTDKHLLKIQVRDSILRMDTLQLANLSQYLESEVTTLWKRKNFADFSYLGFEPTFWQVILIMSVSALLNFGMFLWVLNNDFREYVYNHTPNWTHFSSRNRR